MENIILAFMLLAATICLFAIIVVVMEHIKDRKISRQEQQARLDREAADKARPDHDTYMLENGTVISGYPIYVPAETAVAPAAAPAEEAPVEEAPVEETPVEEAPAEEAPVEEAPVEEAPAEETPAEETPAEETAEDSADPNGVWINRASEKTHIEKYAELTPEARARYDEIKAYVLMQKDVTPRLANRYEDFKNGKKQVVRMVIRREVLYCEFVIVNSDLNTYIVENHVSVKHAPTTIKIDGDEAVVAAKNSVDIAIKAIEEEREYRIEQQKRRRREARARKAAEAAANTTTDEQ